MTNVGTADRLARAAGAAMLIVAAFLVSLPVAGEIALVGMGVYLIGTAAMGTCFGYRLMGKSTCSAQGAST